MDSGFCFEGGSSDEELDKEDTVSQSPWEFGSYSESVADEHARRRTTSVDAKISKALHVRPVTLPGIQEGEDCGGGDKDDGEKEEGEEEGEEDGELEGDGDQEEDTDADEEPAVEGCSSENHATVSTIVGNKLIDVGILFPFAPLVQSCTTEQSNWFYIKRIW